MFPLSRRPRQGQTRMVIRYHDSLAEPSDRCQALAKRFLGAMCQASTLTLKQALDAEHLLSCIRDREQRVRLSFVFIEMK